MGAKELPQFDNLVSGMDYNRPTAPTSDATSTAGAEANQIPDLPQGMPSPLQPMSLETETQLADAMGSRKMSDLHRDGWLDYESPHVSTEVQDGKPPKSVF